MQTRRPGKGKGRRSQKNGNRSLENAPVDTVLVPYVHPDLTDKFTLPQSVSTVFRTLKTTVTEAFITQAATPVFYAVNSTLALNCPDYAQLATVFDQYRIMGVEHKLVPMTTSPTPASQTSGMYATVIDYDDSVALASMAAAYSYADAVVCPTYKEQRRAYVPRMAVAAYAGAFTSYANLAPQWLDVVSNGILHYGIKIAVDGGAAGDVTWNLVTRTLFEFRSSR
jgi:hypothetical protein